MRRKNLEDAVLAFLIFLFFIFGFFLTLNSEIASRFFADLFDGPNSSDTRIIIERRN